MSDIEDNNCVNGEVLCDVCRECKNTNDIMYPTHDADVDGIRRACPVNARVCTSCWLGHYTAGNRNCIFDRQPIARWLESSFGPPNIANFYDTVDSVINFLSDYDENVGELELKQYEDIDADYNQRMYDLILSRDSEHEAYVDAYRQLRENLIEYNRLIHTPNRNINRIRQLTYDIITTKEGCLHALYALHSINTAIMELTNTYNTRFQNNGLEYNEAINALGGMLTEEISRVVDDEQFLN